MAWSVIDGRKESLLWDLGLALQAEPALSSAHQLPDLHQAHRSAEGQLPLLGFPTMDLW